ncbi:SET domain-containing protein 4 [Bombina bombina]|uniref:SET domain-containing protein 4 n=1 Tax=Bombina bombina TaxID=8345 RepID=UPI00235B0B14|nr:SET domain-containing protein 4 [Bombina bombina]
MRSKRGRTGRRRKKKMVTDSTQSAVNKSHDSEYVQLKRWLKVRGFQNHHLRTAEFTDTGRGLMTTKFLQQGELIISLPEKCLITTDTVLQSYLGKYITEWSPPISPLLALCTFLITEKRAGDNSQWKPYVAVLPRTYSCPVYWESVVVHLLPEPAKQKALEQVAELHELYLSSLPFFYSLQSLFHDSTENIFTYDAVRWAWCTVNTRTVYMKHKQRFGLSTEPNNYALAPYLDLLNHSPAVQVEAAFNEKSRCYEIRTMDGCRKYEQVFICYGPHDNQRLLSEYGFVAANNPHQSVYVTKDVILQCVSCKEKQFVKKWSLLRENGFLENLTFGLDGPSWKLLAALKLLCLGPEEFTCWKKILLGTSVSDSNDRNCMELVRKVCTHLLEETSQSLMNISLLKMKKTSENHLALVEALRLEELKILQTSMDILKNGQYITS